MVNLASDPHTSIDLGGNSLILDKDKKVVGSSDSIFSPYKRSSSAYSSSSLTYFAISSLTISLLSSRKILYSRKVL